ncbi:MAG TPA: molybdopterin cofactor-binding domain-containing protein [Verrucomicrobiales bacterium]|nr:molybdopterin cofactor-binding domain-containing protein [Verrucomicrobiales bacterium]
MKPESKSLISSAADPAASEIDEELLFDRVRFHFRPSRRGFVRTLGAGLMLALPASAQDRRGRRSQRGGGGAATLSARLHIAEDGTITVFTGKVECGQGSRAELTQAAAEELRLSPSSVRLLMADTQSVPDDGGTAGSRSTPSTVPAIRAGCAAARELLIRLAAARWDVDPLQIEVHAGEARQAGQDRRLRYSDLAADPDSAAALAQAIPDGPRLTPMDRWEALGQSLSRPNGAGLVTGSHAYPSDIQRPGMLYGRVLRPPSFGARLVSVDLAPVQALEGVTAVHDDQFAGVAAPTSAAASAALRALAAAAVWEERRDHPSSDALFEHLREHAEGGTPENPFRAELDGATHTLRQSYHIPYVQHCPMEPRSAVAEWEDGRLTVWTASQMPFRVRGELAQAFWAGEDRVRVIIPDFGGGFGGKHSGECAVEAARLAQSAGKPVSLQWTREEEFTWAQFRPAALIEAEASLDASGRLTSWHFINVNSGRSAVDTPYRTGKAESAFLGTEAPLRHGSYRALASTANVFARECFMDELAFLAGQDPLAFRLAHLEEGRLRDVLEEAARRFDWGRRSQELSPPGGAGLACGTEKGSFVAACAEVVVEGSAIRVTRVVQVFECGKVLNPANLRAQVEGSILMGLGPILSEETRFAGGRVLNPAFSSYPVPRFAGLPGLEIHLLDRPDLDSAGGGETPLIAVAPAVANAVFRATGQRVRRLPVRLEA